MRVLTLALGWVLLFIGTAGLVLPILPGIPLLISALVILSREYHWAQRLLVRLRDRITKTKHKFQTFRQSYS
jgi:uncharacterized membrane protein YbaN (DUF454 family)